MKKLLTILLLITLAGQTSGYFHPDADGISFMQEAEDKGEKGDKEKNEKEYVSYNSLSKTALTLKRIFNSYSCKPCLSPSLDQPTPPPDDTL